MKLLLKMAASLCVIGLMNPTLVNDNMIEATDLEFGTFETEIGGVTYIINEELFQTATFRPLGLIGRLYWFVVFPFHGAIFNGMLKRIVLENN